LLILLNAIMWQRSLREAARTAYMTTA
jgi:hypothetical protein